MSFGSDFEKIVEGKRKKAAIEAVARATYRVQEDFNNELIPELAERTGHPNLATTVFSNVTPRGEDGLHYHIYNDPSMIEGLFHSNSSFHPGSGGWTQVSQHYGMSRAEFWARKEAGEGGGSYGGIDSEWLADNFWDGIYWATNGWPRGSAEFLSSFPYNDVPAISIIKNYCRRYKASGRFQQYVNEELGN